MAQKKYVSLSKLQTFLDNLSTKFAALGHKHTMSDITDLGDINFTVDSQLSSTSTNPVANNVLDAEFDAIAEAMNALESVVDGKANSQHSHTIDDVDNLQAAIDTINNTLAQKSQVQIVTWEAGD